MRSWLCSLGSVVCLALVGCAFPIADETDALDDDRSPDPFVPELVTAELRWGGAPAADALQVSLGDDLERAYSADGRSLWFRYGASDRWSRYVVEGPLPAGSRLVLGDGPILYDSMPFLVHDGQAYLLPFDPEYQQPHPLERALGSWDLDDAAALDATVTLKLLQACPISHDMCAIFGPPDDVAASEDPLEPETGYLMEELSPIEPVLPPYQERVSVASSSASPGAERITLLIARPVDPAQPPTDEIVTDRAIIRVLFDHRGREIHAVDFASVDELAYPETIAAGIEDLGGQLMVWAWEMESMTVGVSFHDPVTGDRVGDPRVVRMDMYYEPECMAGIYSSRPTPVFGPEGLQFALDWNEGEAILFDPSGLDSAFVPAAIHDDGPPALRTLADDGSLL